MEDFGFFIGKQGHSVFGGRTTDDTGPRLSALSKAMDLLLALSGAGRFPAHPSNHRPLAACGPEGCLVWARPTLETAGHQRQ